MQDDTLRYYDEVEPRKMPKQAAKFDTRPFPMVPEVSLIMDKPRQSNIMNGPVSNNIPEIRTSIPRDSSYRTSESYAAWKEKQFPRQPNKVSPPHYQPIHSSTQNASNFQETHGFREPIKSYHSSDYKDYNYRDHHSDNESPRRYNAMKRYGQMENPNKYVLSHASSHNDIDHHVNNSFNYTPKSRSRDERISPNDRRRSDHSHAVEVYDTRQKPRIRRSSSCSNTDSYARRNVPIDHEYHSKHSRSMQPAHYSPEHTHHHGGCCSATHNSSNTETETVKNLLQIITSQNEQIKTLQKQVERLLKLHEQSLKDRSQCTCQSNGIAYQNSQLYDQARTANVPIVHNNMMKDSERCFSDLKLQDEKNKQTIVEQKVSIGVMTSFELKVQNNPSLAMDNEIKQKSNQEKVLPTSNIIKNLVSDTGEMIRKKPNFFTHTPLENISEGSESHMSSLRQSHLCADSTRQSIEAQESIEVQTYKQNYQENEKLQMNSDSRKPMNTSNDKNVRGTKNLDYEIKEPVYERTERIERTDNGMQERGAYQYSHQYENLRSAPHEESKERKSDEFNSEPLITDITKMKNVRCDNFADECLSLSGSEFDVEELNPPSPEPSIHVDMQEYSSEGGSLPPQRAPKVGWTLYNNVLDQVNQILENTPLNHDPDEDSPDEMGKNDKKEYGNNVIMDTVKAATLEQLTKLGISFSENVDQREPNYNKKVLFDASYYSRQVPETHLPPSANMETNTSMHMKALAMKYLNDDQLADIAMQKPRAGAMKQAPSNVQNTNMSFATMHYLQRYHLLPGTNSSPTREVPRDDYRGPGPVMTERLAKKTVERRAPSPHRYPPFTGSSKVSYPSKILDISTLKQQPKLL